MASEDARNDAEEGGRISEHDTDIRGTRERTGSSGSSAGTPDVEGSGMHARTWAIVYRYYDPADYDIPPLPNWTVGRTDRGGISFAERGSDSFISAEQPVRVRR